jgi:hypothetical protein
MSFEGYVENDYPHQLPLHVPFVALKIEDSEGYGLSDFSAWYDWRSTDLFPNGNGFVKLGPDGEVESSHTRGRFTHRSYKIACLVMKFPNHIKRISHDSYRCFNVPSDALPTVDTKCYRSRRPRVPYSSLPQSFAAGNSMC